jgi:hypothetical protein
MFSIKFNLRSATSWVLVGAISAMLPLSAAEPQPQPGTLATNETLSLPVYDIAHMAALPRQAQQTPDTTPAATGASPAPAAPAHHVSKWVWVAIAAGAGVAIGVGVIAGNSQAGKTAVIAPTVTVNPGGGASAGAP